MLLVIGYPDNRAVLRGRDFFFVKDRLLRSGPDLEFSPFSPVPEKFAELGITAPVSFFLHLGWGRDFFFPVKDRPAGQSRLVVPASLKMKIKGKLQLVEAVLVSPCAYPLMDPRSGGQFFFFF